MNIVGKQFSTLIKVCANKSVSFQRIITFFKGLQISLYILQLNVILRVSLAPPFLLLKYAQVKLYTFIDSHCSLKVYRFACAHFRLPGLFVLLWCHQSSFSDRICWMSAFRPNPFSQTEVLLVGYILHWTLLNCSWSISEWIRSKSTYLFYQIKLSEVNRQKG